MKHKSGSGDMHHVDLVFESKALGVAGEIEGYASIFGNVDQGGDVVEAGAFDAGIVKAAREGRVIPMLWMHDQDEPIGIWTSMAEDRKGLKVAGRLLIEDDPLARRAHAHLKAGSLRGLSIGYRVPPGGAVVDEKGNRHLKLVDLYEVSIVTLPMNPRAVVTGVKADADMLIEKLKAGDRLSEREWERLLKAVPFGLSNSQAERAVRINLKRGQGDPDVTVPTGHDLLRAMLGTG